MNRYYRRQFGLLALTLAVITALSGCSRRDRKTRSQSAEIGFYEPGDDLVVVVVLDVSGSFEEQLFGKDAKAYACLQRVLNSLHQDRVGQRDRLILAQIGGTTRALLWDGRMSDFRSSFGSESAFRSFILARANSQGSRVADSISDAIDHTLSRPTVEKGKTKVAVIVFSDLLENLATATSQTRLTEQLKRLAEHQSAIGLYFVDQPLVATYRDLLTTCGFRPSRQYVAPDFQQNSQLPNFK